MEMEIESLSSVLKNDVIIPEIQREYVWGANENVLNKFLDNIAENVNNNGLNIGFLYSYKPYNDSNIIYLIDGQQRFTTLILLAFCCAIKEEKMEEFEKLLRLNTPTLAFSYRVRVSTEMFLSDLFKKTKTFNTKDVEKEVEDKKWFIESYKNDTSIKAILGALKIIQKFLSDKCIPFEYITKSILFWSFNVRKTSQGEELYITMNSRGEALTSSEQIKPILFEKLEDAKLKSYYGKKWDDWEEHFYSMKNQISDFSINKVDLMMDRFIQTILQIENQTGKIFSRNKNDFSPQEIEKINLSIIEKYFEALERLDKEIKNWEQNLYSCLYDDSQKNKYLYPFAFLLKTIYNNPEIESEEIKRIYQVIRNAVRRNNGNGIVNYVPMLNLLKEYSGTDFYDFILTCEKEKLKNVLDEHELGKIGLIKSSDNISVLETQFWNAQEHEIFNGNIKPLLIWATSDDKFDIESFKEYYEVFNKLLPNNLVFKELDITRRALLTRELKEYPKRFRGYANHSFCWMHSDWKTLIFDNVDKFGLFFKELFYKEDIYAAQIEMIEAFPKEKDYAEFVKLPELLEYCEQKNIQDRGNLGWLLIKNNNATTCIYLKVYRLYLDLRKKQKEHWKINDRDDMCLFFDFAKNNSTIKVYYNENGEFNIQLLNQYMGTYEFFSKLSSSFDLSFKDEYYESKSKSREDIILLLDSIILEVEKL